MAKEPKHKQPEQTGSRLPMFYKNVVPVNSAQHGDLKFSRTVNFSYAKDTNILPITVEEFGVAQRFFPIVFAPSGEGHPLALLGLKEGENRFVEEDGSWRRGTYVPGYVRRYPFILARRSEEDTEFTLGMDADASRLNKDEGDALFEDNNPSELTNQAVEFCKRYEEAAHQTRLFVKILNEHDLLKVGEVNLMADGKPIKYDGFKMVDEQKLNALSDEAMLTLAKNGALAAIHAHLLSLAAFQGLFIDTFAAN